MENKFHFCVNIFITKIVAICSCSIKTILAQCQKNINFFILDTKLLNTSVNLTLPHVLSLIQESWNFSLIDLILYIHQVFSKALIFFFLPGQFNRPNLCTSKKISSRLIFYNSKYTWYTMDSSISIIFQTYQQKRHSKIYFSL